VSAAVLSCVCAWCERVRTGSGDWRQQEPPEVESPEVTHGICPECLAEETDSASPEHDR